MLSIRQKLGFPTETLKQNFLGNEFSISGTQETHFQFREHVPDSEKERLYKFGTT